VITIKAGNGGSGHTSFLRDRQTVSGGPDGGDGGKGGDIIFVGTTRVDNLIDFRFAKRFIAGNGGGGRPLNKSGAAGDDLLIPVPLGTKIFKSGVGESPAELLQDIVTDGQRYCALRGGAGGRGNAHFATSRRQTPNFSQVGIKTLEYKVILELNCIADVGLIGFPNAGKSTLLSVITRANPKIGNYHFTTVHPNIGVYAPEKNSGEGTVIFADIPGIIEGAHTGTGLGTDFLKHIKRTRLLAHLVDISEQEGRDAINDFEIINKELAAFSPALAAKPQIIVLNKIDTADSARIAAFKKSYGTKFKIFEISALAHQGIDELMKYICLSIVRLPRPEPEIADAELEAAVDRNAFEVTAENDGSFTVKGAMVDNLVRGVVLSDTESAAYFMRRLEKSGAITALKDVGMKNGDTVRIADTEFEWTD
jgi:GTP-binding protein